MSSVHTKSGQPHGRHVRALDGLRGVAITAVVAYHVSPTRVPFGSVGVTVFFVLSGYLITTLIVRERDQTGRFDFIGFYLRRGLRLYPALLLTVVVTGVLLVVLQDPAAGSYPAEALTSLLYLADISQPLGVQMPRLGHLWSLAVEEQFYLLWPVLLLAVLTAALRRRRLLAVTAVLAGIALVWRAYVVVTSSDVIRMYFAPDINAAPLLAGALLGIILRGRISGSRTIAVSMLAAIAVVCVIPQVDPTLQHWQLMMLFGTVAMVLALPLVWAAPRAGAVLENGAVVWLGRVSYGWYLWHQALWGVHPFGLRTDSTFVHAAVALIGLAFAAISFHFVELPLQRRLRPLIGRVATSTAGLRATADSLFEARRRPLRGAAHPPLSG